MSKVLKRLYLGDVVKSFGTKQLRKLTTEEPITSVVGTWYFKETPAKTSRINVEFYFIKNGTKYNMVGISADPDYIGNVQYWLSSGGVYIAKHNGVWNKAYRTIYITNDSNMTNADKTWLKANATKQ